MRQTLALIRVSLEANADPHHRDGMKRYFKEDISPLGVRSADMNKVVASTWRRISGWDKDAIFQLCDLLWQAGVFEEGSLACKLSARLGKRLEEDDFSRLETWMDTHVTNWAHCDDLSTHAAGSCLLSFPALRSNLRAWATSDNRWMRRGAMVSLVYPLRKDELLSDALALADLLMDDPDDMVQKGLGWMLKEATRHNAEKVLAYVLHNKARMARIALRTAIEKLPSEARKQAMTP